jgi:hypothetical protein
LFFERLGREHYDRSDVYSNRDLPACVRARRDAVLAVKAALKQNPRLLRLVGKR